VAFQIFVGGEMGACLANNRVNATVRPVTPLAAASGAPGRPARYAVRWTDD